MSRLVARLRVVAGSDNAHVSKSLQEVEESGQVGCEGR